MRGRGWIRDIISHFLIVALLATGLIYLRKKADDIPALARMEHLDIVFYIAFALLLLMVIIFFFQLFSSVKLERFSPGNPESIRRLDRIRRFKLRRGLMSSPWQWSKDRAEVIAYLLQEGWKKEEISPFAAVLIRRRKIPTFKKPPLVDRLFVFYHPMLNVLIVDQMLKECEQVIEDNKDNEPAPRNRIIFLTDMCHKEEVTSAGAGVVNYLCTPFDKVSLYPLLFDHAAGRLFYPLDTTLAPRRHRFYFWIHRITLKRWIVKHSNICRDRTAS